LGKGKELIIRNWGCCGVHRCDNKYQYNIFNKGKYVWSRQSHGES